MKNPMSKILLINLLLLLTIFTYESTVYAAGEAFQVSILVALNFLVSIINFILKNNERGKTYLLATALLLLVGFGLCVLKSQIYAPASM